MILSSVPFVVLCAVTLSVVLLNLFFFASLLLQFFVSMWPSKKKRKPFLYRYIRWSVIWSISIGAVSVPIMLLIVIIHTFAQGGF